MAVTQNTYTGNGSTVLYSFTFPYLETTDVKVSLNGTVTTAYTFANATTIQFNTAPANGVAIRIYRVTDDSALSAQFYPGSAIRSQDLNDNFTQNLYVTQESNRDATQAITTANSATTTANTALSNSAAAVSTANTASSNASAAVSTANTASSNASAAVSTANTASTNATTAVNTANTAASNAATALSTANTALSTANTASTNATAAVSTANTASTNASAAVSTANTASTNAASAVSTANTASSNATTAVNTANAATVTANAAAAAVANAVLYTTVANVAAIPATPANNTAVEVTNSTGIESFTPLSGLPVGFVGSSGLSVRIIYQTAGTTWTWIQYFPNDPENRYLKEAGDTMTGALGVTAGTAAAPSIFVSGDPNTGIYSPGADQVAISTGGSGRLFINSSGQVGVGVSPSASLEVNGEARFTRSGVASQYVGITGDGTDTRIVAEGASKNLTIKNNSTTSSAIIFDQAVASSYIFNQAGSERLRITSAGLVGVGVSSPSYNIHGANYAGLGTQASSGAGAGIHMIPSSSLTNWFVGANYVTSGAFQIIPSTAGGGSTFTTPAVTVDSSSRVGIGVTGPQAIFHSKAGATTSAGIFESTSASGSFLSFVDTGTSSYTRVQVGSVGNELVFRTTDIERCRVDLSGRLLIGTSSASSASRLVVSGNHVNGEDSIFTLNRGSATTSADQTLGRINFTNGGDTAIHASILCVTDAASGSSDNPGRLVFSTTADGASSPTERMRITSAGRALFGAAAPTAENELYSFQGVTGATSTLSMFAVTAAGQYPIRTWNSATSGTRQHLLFMDGLGTARGSITTDGSSTSFNTTSDYRLKENVELLTGATERLSQIPVHRFNFIGSDATVDGFIAHEVQAVIPEAVVGTKDEVDDDGNPLYQGIDQSKLVPLLTAALQEAIGEIESLKARLTAAGI